MEVQCPKCGATAKYIIYGDIVDGPEIRGNDCYLIARGYCTHCDSSLTWTEVYTLDRFENIKIWKEGE